MFRMTPVAIAGAALALMPGLTAANDVDRAMQDFAAQAATSWVQDPVIISAIRSQNIRHRSLTPTQIDEMDLKWRAEISANHDPLITSVVETPASDFLRDQAQGAAGLISEVFVMDRMGLNVASSGVTSDYWQGDEAKFQQTYQAGPAAIHMGEVEFDESTQSYVAQVSFTVVDPDTQIAIGAVTISLNAELLL